MKLSNKAVQRLEKLHKVEELYNQAKREWNPVAASAIAKEAKSIIEVELVDILKDAIIVIDQFEQGGANNE